MKKLCYILISFLRLMVSNGFSQNCVLRVNVSMSYNGWAGAWPIENNGDYRIVGIVQVGRENRYIGTDK